MRRWQVDWFDSYAIDVAALHDDLEILLSREVHVLTAGSVKGCLAHMADEAIPL